MLIGITGQIGHGKTSIANMLVEKYGFTRVSFADAVREMAVALDPYVSVSANRHFTEGDTPFARYTDVLRYVGYAGAKGFSDVRRMLQRIGTEAGRGVLGDDVWVNTLCRKLGALGFPDANIVIDDVRFENEAEMVRNLGYLLQVRRLGYENGVQAHASEQGVELRDGDIDIEAGKLENLLRFAESAYQQFLTAEMDKALSNTQASLEVVAPRVYVAATWENKAEAIAAKHLLTQAGITVVSTWTEREASEAVTASQRRERAITDFEEVMSVNTIVVLAAGKSEGKSTEFGIALTSGRRVIVVGADVETQNVFYNLPQVEHVNTVEQVIRLLVNGLTPEKDAHYAELADKFEPTGGFERTLDPTTGRPLPGTPWDGMPVDVVETGKD